MINLSMVIISLVVGIIVGAVVLTQLAPIAGDMGTCPTGNSSGLPKILQDACGIFVGLGGVIIIVGVILGIVAYFKFFA